MSADCNRSVRALFAALLALLALGGCAWFSDFRDQPRVEPWEAEYRGDTVPFPGNPQMSVPITGSIAPGYMVSYSPTIGALDSLAVLQNPTAPTPASLERGRLYYQINCTVCHGAAGAGDGPALRYGVPAPTLLGQVTRDRTDGYLFGIMRNGRGLMPNYARIPEEARWDVVNYIRALQRVLDVPVSTDPAGVPGEGGPAVPGPSRTAPTRPVPHFQQPRAGQAAAGAPERPAASDEQRQGERP